MNRTYFLAVFLFACSSENPATDAGADAPNDAPLETGVADAPPDAPPDAQTCSSFTTDAAAITQMFVATDTPVGDGGPFVEGVYDVTAWSVYTGVDGGAGPTGMTVQATQLFAAGAYQYDERFVIGDAGGVLDTSGTYKLFDGGGAVATQKCPGPNPPPPFTSYSSDGTNVTFYATNPPWGLAMKRR